MHRSKDVLTTGQVAKICNVAPRTVSKWFDNGQLHGYRIPGSKDRRIPLSQLVRFMRAHNIPMDTLDVGQLHVLLIDGDETLMQIIRRSLETDEQCRVSTCTTAFEAGVIAGQVKLDVIIVDVSLPDVVPAQLCRTIRANPDLQDVHLIAISGGITNGQGHGLVQQGFDSFLRKPFEMRQLVHEIETRE
jgi:excisionase family DNA binding protein